MENYFDVKALSSSAINAYIKSPLLFWKNSVFNPKKMLDVPTESMIFGNLVHTLIFEPDTFEDNYFVHNWNARLKDTQQKLNEVREQHPNKKIIRQKTMNDAQGMAGIIKNCSLFQDILKTGEKQHFEHEIYWNNNNLPCKAKLDFYNGQNIILDYKTTSLSNSPDFAKTMVKYGYHRQAAFYKLAVKETTGQDCIFVFLVQDKECPSFYDYYEVDEHTLDIGTVEVMKAIEHISESLENGRWEKKEKMIYTVSLPDWYFNKRIEE